MSKKILLFGAFVLFSIFLIGLVSACYSAPECCRDSDCPEDYYSENYCLEDDVYKDFHDWSCEGRCRHKECAEDVFSELVEECGEDEYGQWENYCEGNDLYKQRYYAQHGCSNGECFIGTVTQSEFVKECDYMCVEGECIDEPEPVCGDGVVEDEEECDDGNNDNGDGCSAECVIEYCGDGIINNINEQCEEDCDCGEGYYCGDCMCYEEPPEPECYVNEDCGIDHCLGGPNYCLEGDVYQDFITYTCNNPGEENAYCSSDIIPWLLEECLCGCENSECVECPEPPVCGNGLLEGDEECDDGNTEDFDGCSAECLIETPEPECYNDEDCSEDYYSDKYCVDGDVYYDFHDFSCVLGECFEQIIPKFVEECNEDCEDGECVEEDDDGGGCCSSCGDSYEAYDEEFLTFYNEIDSGSEEGRIILVGQPDSVEQTDSFEKSGKATDSSWIVYLFIGCLVLLVLILISLAVKR